MPNALHVVAAADSWKLKKPKSAARAAAAAAATAAVAASAASLCCCWGHCSYLQHVCILWQIA
jgi:hypothetical protein